MNISTGGPHILLFERDQQLTTLLVSELQLAGYTNHTARTAVEVFDAIARFPTRIVLVNLAQAAAARREFWVALDSQRRDRKVQVMTFLCTNLAGYGPRDLEDRSSIAIPDVEVDGMMGLMHLVDAVRARVPVEAIETTANTLPRMPKVSSTASSPSMPRPQQPSTPSVGTTYRPTADMNAQQAATRTYATPPPPTSTSFAPPASPASYPSSTNQAPIQGSTTSNQPNSTEKIRAVLYPNQRTWSAQGINNYPVPQENRDMTAYASRSYNASTLPGPSDSALQRLAGGQTNDGGNESGLAQLSRMAQGYRSPFEEESTNAYTSTEPMIQPANTRPTSTLYQPEATQPAAPYTTASTMTYTPQAEINMGAPGAYPQVETNDLNSAYATYVSPSARPTQVNENSQMNTISTQTLRASPIQDMPIERTTGSATPESTKRPDVLSRANYGQQLAQIAQQLQNLQLAQPASPPLASISTPMPSSTPAPASREASTTPKPPAPSSPLIQKEVSEEGQREGEERAREVEREVENKGTVEGEKENKGSGEGKQSQSRSGIDLEEGLTANNAVLLDIVQSLPPMPAISEQPPQSVQPQVLSGRATRSLGKVLLDGHLVPHDRLEVAQNIQRMLRGVDLNYQLGEILLMFKLLTPDQLLAASLVSYGLITTTQISALGRIRQELHAIGLEYDLENLLVLFRILTPEQLREVRASLQS